MITINRTVIVVMPGQPFLDWLHRADPTSGELSLEDLRREPTVYLLPECENEEEARECLEEVCGEIFEEQLNGWYRVLSSWPSRRDLDAFDRWFEWSFHSVVVDLCDDPLLQEEIWPARLHFVAGAGGGLSSWTLRGLDCGALRPFRRRACGRCFTNLYIQPGPAERLYLDSDADRTGQPYPGRR